MTIDHMTLHERLEPAVEAMGYELVHIQLAGGKQRSAGQILRVYIDAPGGIRVDDCAAVSRRLSALLDVEDPVAGAYTLEVSSPGVDRPLAKPEHFRRFQGQRARIVLHAALHGRRRWRGELVAADERGVVLHVEGERYALAYDAMDSARLEPAL